MASVAALSAYSRDTYNWSGESSSDWNTKANWFKEGSKTTHAVPTGDINCDFKSPNYSDTFVNDGLVVSFAGAYTSQWKAHVRNAGSKDAPLVFRATARENGWTVGTKSGSSGEGFLVGYDVGDGWLRIESGTYKTGAYGRWTVGGTYSGYITALEGVTMYAKEGFFLQSGEFHATGVKLDSDGALTIGGVANKSFYAVKDGGDWNVKGEVILGGASGASGTLTIDGGTLTVASGKWTKCTAGAGTLNLNGGEFVTEHIRKDGAGSISVNLNGGTLKAKEENANGLIGGAVAVTVGENGGTIDTGEFSISVTSAISAVPDTAGAFTVKGGGSATFTSAVNLAGALAVGDGTALHLFDQDGAVSPTCRFSSLALGAGSTIFLDGNATGVDALPSVVTTTATAENKAVVEIAFSALPAPGTAFSLFPAASADVFDVKPVLGSLEIPCTTSVENGNLVLTISAEDYVWNGTGTNWGDEAAWTKSGSPATWADANAAVFETANAAATLAADASPAKIDFRADATVSGSATLTVPDAVSVAPGVTATISAPIAGALRKTGGGTLVLGASRTEQTTVSEGTLKLASGATVDPSKLTLGTDASKPVTLDLGGQTLSTDLSAAANRYMAAGMDVTLTNGTFATTANPGLNGSTAPSVLTIAKDAVLTSSKRFTWNASQDSSLDTETTVNIAGGQMISLENNNNWFVQNSRCGTLNINVTDGGLFTLSGLTYMMPCRDNSTAADTPRMSVMFKDSVFRLPNKNLYMGYDNEDQNKNPLEPRFSLAMTNSVLDVGTGKIILGHDKIGANTAGSYTADFAGGTVVTTKQFSVYMDRPLNRANFDGAVLVATGSVDYFLEQQGWNSGASGGVTVGSGGFTIDTQNYVCGLRVDIGGTGSVSKKGTGTLRVDVAQTGAGALNVDEGTLALSAGVSSTRAISVASGAKLEVSGSSAAALAGLSLASGATLNLASYAEGTTPLDVESLSLPESGEALLTFGGAAFAIGRYAVLEKTGISAESVEGRLVPSVPENVPYSWNVSGDTLYLAVGGANACFWTGKGDGSKFSDGGNWLDGAAPSSGVDVFVSLASAGTLVNDIPGFAPASITFPVGSAAVTISGENAITGVAAVTNLSAASHTIECPVYFTGNIQVKQNADIYDRISQSHVTFAGGAYAAEGYSIETGPTVTWSRCMFGEYFLRNAADDPWSTVVYTGCRPAVAPDSTLHVPYAGNLTELHVGAGAEVLVGEMVNTEGRVSYKNNGEVRVERLTLTGSIDRYLVFQQGTSVAAVYKFRSVTNSMTGNWFYLGDSSTKASFEVYVGEGGLNFQNESGSAAYCLGKDLAGHKVTLRPWDSDFRIGARSTDAVGLCMNRDVVFLTDDEEGIARTITIDAKKRARTTATAVSVSGSGTLRVNGGCANDNAPTVAVTESSTLAIRPGAGFGESSMTVGERATLQVAESGVVALSGNMTLEDGATLAFNFTERGTAPVLDLTGKTLTLAGGASTVVVGVSADDGVRPFNGAGKFKLTEGALFSGATVAATSGLPRWATAVDVVDGDIWLGVKSSGFMLLLR